MLDDNKINIKAIIIGTLITIIGNIGDLIFNFCFIFQLFPLGYAQTMFPYNPFYLIFSLVRNFGLTFLGSFVAVRIAKKREILHANIIGVTSLILVVLSIKFNAFPIWYTITFLVLIIPVAILGGSIAKNKTEKEISNSLEQKKSNGLSIASRILLSLDIICAFMCTIWGIYFNNKVIPIFSELRIDLPYVTHLITRLAMLVPYISLPIALLLIFKKKWVGEKINFYINLIITIIILIIFVPVYILSMYFPLIRWPYSLSL